MECENYPKTTQKLPKFLYTLTTHKLPKFLYTLITHKLPKNYLHNILYKPHSTQNYPKRRPGDARRAATGARQRALTIPNNLSSNLPTIF